MKIKKNGVCEHSQIDEFEKRIKCKLPSDYVTFLLNTNGGEIEGEKIQLLMVDGIHEISIKHLFGFVDDSETSLLSYNEEFVGDVNNTIVIGEDEIGNPVILSQEEHEMSVYYCDIKNILPLNKKGTNIFKLANSFSDLLIKMRLLSVIGGKDMEKINYYPLGSIVKLKNAKKGLVIIGRGLFLKQDNRKQFVDYAGVPYPEGMMGDQVAYFNHEMIEKVIFEGFSDKENEMAVEDINYYLNNHSDIERFDATINQTQED